MTLRRTTPLTRRTELARTPLKQKTAMQRAASARRATERTRDRASIRTLDWEEPLPEDITPRRYRDGRGYIRLRWLIGPQTYVEEYEHRIVAGRPHPSMEVHHLNGIKHDNRPENLEVLSKVEHARLHAAQYRVAGKWKGRTRDLERASRRVEREQTTAQMAADYRAGMSTIELGEKYGLHSSGVSRRLRAAGVRMRPATGYNQLRRSQQVVKARANLRCERCGVNLKFLPGQVHHRRPRGMGGSTAPETNAPANLVHLCHACHAEVESHRTQAIADGWLVHQGTDPATVPIKHKERGLVLLDDDGDYVEGSP